MSLIRAYGFRVEAPRAPSLTVAELDDLTTAPARASGTLSPDALHIVPAPERWTRLDAPVPGTLVRGTLPDDHRARFLLRIPRDWNGRLVVAAASGITDETTYDLYFSDHALSRGFAFAATDKGVRRALIDGDTVLMPMVPEAGLARWASRLEALTVLARAQCAERRGRAPERTYAIGLSNGGFLARRAAESATLGIDGAVEVSGVMWRADRGNLLRELPAALRATAREPWDRDALAALGYDGGDRWDAPLSFHRSIYWESSLGLFVQDLDPEYAGPIEDYDFDARPASVRARVEALQNTGDLRAPLFSIAGTRDHLISCSGHARAYADLVRERGRADLHRLEIVEDAGHVDAISQQFPFQVPLMPRLHAAFDALVERVEGRAFDHSKKSELSKLSKA